MHSFLPAVCGIGSGALATGSLVVAGSVVAVGGLTTFPAATLAVAILATGIFGYATYRCIKYTRDSLQKKEIEPFFQHEWHHLQKLISGIFRQTFALTLDTLLILPALGITLLSMSGAIDCNPKENEIKTNKIPILFVHGMTFNRSQWVVGQHYLNDAKYGSLFSLNLDSWLWFFSNKSVEDYAETLKEKIDEIKQKTGKNKVILIGHSMGGLVAEEYAKKYDPQEKTIKKIITIATPWHGAPILNVVKPLLPHCHTPYLQEMLPGEKNTFRCGLVTHAQNSKARKYYSIWSETDTAVPNSQGKLTCAPDQEKKYTYLGHLGIVIWPSVWHQITTWIDEDASAIPEMV